MDGIEISSAARAYMENREKSPGTAPESLREQARLRDELVMGIAERFEPWDGELIPESERFVPGLPDLDEG